MKKPNRGRRAWPLTIALSLLIAATAYLNRGHLPSLQAFAQESGNAAPTTDAAKGKILYYKDPMGGPETSPVPKKDWMGMDFLPVYEGDAAAQPDAAPAAPASGQGKILYYKDPMGGPDTSPVPKKDSMGMDYLPVYEGHETPPKPRSQVTPAADKGKVVYYRNPMGLADVSPVPKKDSMGMNYIPVYENEAASSNVVQVSLDKVQKLGVMSEPAVFRRLVRAIRAVGTVQIDESRQVIVTSKFEGWIEKLQVTKTGDTVSRGDSLLEIFSPTLRIAESQYLSTLKSSPELARTAKDQLRNKGMTDEQIISLEGQTTPPRTMTISAPSGGQVIEKQAILGMRVEAGDPLYRLVDLSHVWVVAEIHEQDLALMRSGLPVDIAFDAFPGKSFSGTVSLVYPMVAMDTRTAQVRIEMDNKEAFLKPGMFANVSIAGDMQTAEMLTIPENAVLDDGLEQTVLIDRGEGKFEPRSIEIGSGADGYVAVTNGLVAGDKVVVSANFLIDAESNLQAALRAFMTKQTSAAEPTP